MPELPSGDHNFYVGIDPGFSGAIGRISADGSSVQCWDMPTVQKGGAEARRRELDLAALRQIMREIRLFPSTVVGLEWPTTRPGEGAERSERFGRQKGILQAFCYLHRLPYFLIAPNLWKGRLSLPGKTNPDANKLAAKLFDLYYPESGSLVRGPRGGLKDGRIDALLIAHWLRVRGRRGMQSVVDQFGRDSQQAWALMMAGKRPKVQGLRF
jgi:hypothetical protein